MKRRDLIKSAIVGLCAATVPMVVKAKELHFYGYPGDYCDTPTDCKLTGDITITSSFNSGHTYTLTGTDADGIERTETLKAGQTSLYYYR